MEALKNMLFLYLRKDHNSAFDDGEHSMDNFLTMDQTRLLHDTNETSFGSQDGVSSSMSPASKSSNEQVFHMPLFWTVNFVFVLLMIGVFIWCVKFNGSQHFVDWMMGRQQSSDLEYARRLAQRRIREEERSKDSPEERREKLKKCFQRCQNKMVLKEEDFRHDDSNICATDIETGSMCSNNTSAEHVCLQLKDEGSKTRLVPNCCAVCLCPYDPGETIVWSYNADCTHAFHDECLIDWFIKMQNGTPCPCCRREFTDLTEQEEKIKKQRYQVPPQQFDLRTITL